jgi:iron complex outermembrane receptor protein
MIYLLRRLLWGGGLIYCAALLAGESGAPDELLLFFDEKELYVESASRLKEKSAVAPGVGNVITAEDIRKLGARNLMDVLATIPGFTDIQDVNESHGLAGRGVFATSTHKILLLRDGHRMNEPLFESLRPSNGISLASIKRIEVVRGPGASLYGNAALLGVINIVTVDADEPSRVAVTGGNFGQIGGDLLYNRKLENGGQFLLFGHVREHGGEKVRIPVADDLAANPLGGRQPVEEQPFNYDVGVKYRTDEVQFLAAARRAAYRTPRSNDGAVLTGADALVHPFEALESQYVDLAWSPRWNGIQFKLRHYADRGEYDSPQYQLTARDRPPNGQAFDLGLESARAGLEYSALLEHTGGALLAGFQFENFWLLDSDIASSRVDFTSLHGYHGLRNVSEWDWALYLQEKYELLPGLTLNAGLRWDNYQSFGDSFNPRAALAYNPFGEFYLKLSYGRAFQAPSYFYRTENEGLGYGSPSGLGPERAENVQISAENAFGKYLWLRVTGFRNEVDDLITRPLGSPTYRNVGSLVTEGIESEMKIKVAEPLELFANHTYMWPVSGATDDALLSDGNLSNIPRHLLSAGVKWQWTAHYSGSVYVNWHDPIPSPVLGPSEARSDPEHEIAPAAIVNLTLNARDVIPGFDAQVAVHNLLDQRDFRGGTTRVPYPQEGRNILFTVGWSY